MDAVQGGFVCERNCPADLRETILLNLQLILTVAWVAGLVFARTGHIIIDDFLIYVKAGHSG